MNIVVLKGNLTRDPEIKVITTASGKQITVANFDIAVSRFFKRADGSRDQDTTFVSCEAWDSGAETIGKIMSKGDPILIQGGLKLNQWEQEDGQKRSRLLVRVERFDKLNRATPKDNSAPTETPAVKEEAMPVEPQAEKAVQSGDDVPF